MRFSRGAENNTGAGACFPEMRKNLFASWRVKVRGASPYDLNARTYRKVDFSRIKGITSAAVARAVRELRNGNETLEIEHQ